MDTGDLSMIPIVHVAKKGGKERVVGQASDEASAERLVVETAALFPNAHAVYVDYSRSVEEVKRNAA